MVLMGTDNRCLFKAACCEDVWDYGGITYVPVPSNNFLFPVSAACRVIDGHGSPYLSTNPPT
jgi:hypothetical protein